MTISLKHAFQSAVADGGDTTLVQPSNWNAEHTLTLATGTLLGRTTAGTGSAEEISAGSNLTLSSGTLNANVGLGANTFTGAQTIGNGTLTASAPVLDLSQTWNNSGVTFTGIKSNVTDTASAAASLLMDLQTGGVSKFSVRKDGTANSTLLQVVDAATPSTIYAIFGSNVRLNSGTVISWSNVSTGPAGANADLFLTRRAAANLRLGAADAAAPVAQTLSVQSVVAGTTDTAGANLTFTGSQSTGTGAAGRILFQTASAAASTGTAQNALATVLTIGPNTLTGTQAISLLDMAQTWNTTGTPTALKLNVTDTASNASSLLMDLQVGSVSKAKIDKNGYITAPRLYWNSTSYSSIGASNLITFTETNGTSPLGVGAHSVGMGAITALAWWTNNIVGNGSTDTFITRRGAANVRLGSSDAAAPVAQTLSVQSVVAGTSNTAGANLTITGSQGTGTGAGGSIIFQTAAAGSSGTAQNALGNALTLAADKSATFAGQIISNAVYSTLAFKSSAGDTGFSANANGMYFRGNGVYIYAISGISPTAPTASLNSASLFGFSSGSPDAALLDTIITRRGAANLRFGAADAAAPVAQTLSVQSVVAGTSNTAGANLTITGSQGTGTGAGGDILFQVAAAGTSGTAQNALATALRIYSTKTVAVGAAYTVATLPAAGTQGRRAWVTDATAPTFLGALIGGGTVVCPVFDNGTAWVAG